MLKYLEKEKSNSISLTGLRALVIIGLLLTKPHSINEIREALINYNIIKEDQKDDILRIDLNTIKLMGCELSRPTVKDDYKYTLIDHPFGIKFPKEEIQVLKRTYNKVKDSASLSTLIAYDDLFKRIASHICDDENREMFLGISILKYYDIDLIKELILDCKQKSTLEIVYKKPTKVAEYKKEIIAQKLEVKNDKIYLFCYDLDNEKHLMLKLSRILKIVSRKFRKNNVEPKTFNVKFLIKNIENITLEENENIIESTDNGVVVEGQYFNNFIAMQRVLSFGANCIVIAPADFRDNVIVKIKEMRETYAR